MPASLFFFSRYFSEPKEEPTGSIIAASRKKNLIDNGIVQWNYQNYVLNTWLLTRLQFSDSM